MDRSVDRILTTHVGSLPRPAAVLELLLADDQGAVQNDSLLNEMVEAAVADVVSTQFQIGIDVPSDGEMSKISYATYIRHRLSGFDEIVRTRRSTPADLAAFPEFKQWLDQFDVLPAYQRPVCRGPIVMKDVGPLRSDIAHFEAALGDYRGDAFMNSASPGVISNFHPNEYYPNNSDYLQAIADAMKIEYETIYQSGLVLQIDCPDLAMERHVTYASDTDDEFLNRINEYIDILNHALENVPADRVRMHVCWGNYEGPHISDIPLRTIIKSILRAKPAALLIEAANPRHAHEWAVWEDIAFPEDKILVPGVIDTTTNFVEHPDLVAERLIRFARVVGRERVIAGTDCGFGTFAGFGAVHPSVCWPKLRALVEGAQIASEQLW